MSRPLTAFLPAGGFDPGITAEASNPLPYLLSTAPSNVEVVLPVSRRLRPPAHMCYRKYRTRPTQ